MIQTDEYPLFSRTDTRREAAYLVEKIAAGEVNNVRMVY